MFRMTRVQVGKLAGSPSENPGLYDAIVEELSRTLELQFFGNVVLK